MKSLLKAGLLVVAAASFASAARADISGLLAGREIQIGDKIFSDFTFAGPAGKNNPQDFNITPIGDGSAGNLWGIRIGGPFEQVGSGTSDWQLTYSVRTAPGSGMLISDIHQYVNVASIDLNTAAHVEEEVLDGPSGVVLARSNVGKSFTTLDQTDPPAEFLDTLVLGRPLSQVWVKKDILMVAGRGESISGTIIEQRFSQVPVPEPTTILAGALLLLPFGASTFRMLRRKNTAA